MSLRYEQYNAIKLTKILLYDLLDTQNRPRRVHELKQRVYKCLRHYPILTERGEPIFSKDNLS